MDWLRCETAVGGQQLLGIGSAALDRDRVDASIWRAREGFGRGKPLPSTQHVSTFWHINHLQLVLVILIPFVASAMARGII